jgi:HAD superfamily hydrolase (TIGR01548 family)
MDGVLVDVRDSYRKAIQETVKFFTEKRPSPLEIQRLKEKGGYNNDWDLTEALVLARGKLAPKAEIVRKFQEFYLGRNGKPGLIENETWLLSKERLVDLQRKYCLGIVTGRPRAETVHVLKKFGVEQFFDVVVAMEDYPADKAKPDPYPVCLALKKLGAEDAVYVGDSVDDIDSAVRAGIDAVGCIPPGVPSESLKDLLITRGAQKVIQNINQLK